MEALKAMMSKKKEQLKSTKLIDQGEVERKRQEQARDEIEQRERERERKLIEKLTETDKFYQSRKKIKPDTEGKEVLLPEANIDESTVHNGLIQANTTDAKRGDHPEAEITQTAHNVVRRRRLVTVPSAQEVLRTCFND